MLRHREPALLDRDLDALVLGLEQLVLPPQQVELRLERLEVLRLDDGRRRRRCRRGARSLLDEVRGERRDRVVGGVYGLGLGGRARFRGVEGGKTRVGSDCISSGLVVMGGVEALLGVV